MNIYVYSAGQDFYLKMASLGCISHKRANPEAHVFLLTTDNSINEQFSAALSREGIIVRYFPRIKEDLASIALDGDYTRFHTFARWECFLKDVIQSTNTDEIFALLDPDIISLNKWDDIQENLSIGEIAFTRQLNWDNFINGGFIVGHLVDMRRVGTFLIERIRRDVSEGAFVRSPYDQIYWNRYYHELVVKGLCVGADFIRLSFQKEFFKAKLVHQIDFKGFLFMYPIINQIASEYHIPITESDMAKY